jgi:hypothetical protein
MTRNPQRSANANTVSRLLFPSRQRLEAPYYFEVKHLRAIDGLNKLWQKSLNAALSLIAAG